MSDPSHLNYEEDVGAYLLGALPLLEHRAFERHLEECEMCRRDVERLRPAGNALQRAVPPLDPPPSLKASLMEIVEREAAERTSADPAAPAPGWRTRLASRLRPRPAARLRPAFALAAVLLAVGVGAGYGLSQGLSGDDGSRSVVAQVDSARLPAGASARLVVPEGKRGAVLQVAGMPTLDPNAVYQVWLQRDGKPVSQSLFTVGADGTGAGAVRDSVKDADAVLVTREPRGGSASPSERPVLTARL